MNVLFEESSINSLTLSNRFIRSATWEGMAANDGAVTPELIEKMRQLAIGGVGLIISSHAFVQLEGKAGPGQLGIDKDDLIEGLSDLTNVVHENGGRIILQLAHAGHFAFESSTGCSPWVVSDFSGLSEQLRHELSREDIGHLVNCFKEAGRRAKTAGFDGVQIHAAHGYLLSQFLSPFYNRRTDEYGGSLQNRSRIHLEILKAIRSETGDDYPVFIKINCEDFDDTGLTANDAKEVAKILDAGGIDAIELSGGLLSGGKLSPSRSRIFTEEAEAYFREQAKEIKKELSVPLILVGGVRSLDIAVKMVEEGFADYISMSRPFIREPDLINRWKSGESSKAACKSDNLCFKAAMKGGVYCVSEEREKVNES